MAPLCVKCGEIGHVSRDCTGRVLPAWEQSYLKSLVFGNNPQANFSAAGYGAFDGNLNPYGIDDTVSTDSSSTAFRPDPSSSKTGADLGCGSVMYGISQEVMDGPPVSVPDPTIRAASVDVLYGEGSSANKRPYLDMAAPSQIQDHSMSTSGKPKKKGQKRIGKKTEPQPLVGMFDESSGAYDKPVSVRQVLKANKVDMTWMDWMAWSPDACKELKRLCTRVAKKRVPKPKPASTGPAAVLPFLPPTQFNPAVPVGPTLPPLASWAPTVPIPTINPNGSFAELAPPQSASIPMQQIPEAPIHIPIPMIPPQQVPLPQPVNTNNPGEVVGVTASCHTQFLRSLEP